MSINPSIITRSLNLKTPIIGFYDSPHLFAQSTLIKPDKGSRSCIFSFYKNWQRGQTLLLTKENFDCPGCGHWIFGIPPRSREDYIRFLVDEEGLKVTPQLMDQWLDYHQPYMPAHDFILIGPLQGEDSYLKTITFFVNPDQLSILMTGAQYHAGVNDPNPVIAPFGSGCMELLPLFTDLNIPQAIIGATDLAMRKYLPPDMLSFTVTKVMYQRLCALDEKSFLFKPFLKNLRTARKDKL